MNIFTKTAGDEQRFSEFLGSVDKVTQALAPYSGSVDLSQLKKVRDSFVSRTEDFFRTDRKLNIGVIGQVKAGKSTFLNTLLFGGKEVLPSAATPKTATLTKIEYSEDNRLIVEYYSDSEWKILEDNAKVDSKDNEFEAAREIMKMARENGLNVSEYISRGSDSFDFDSPDTLMDKLDDYVEECGKYTALVKNVTILMNNPDLKDISIVDTPGLNDAIASRTDRTRQFIELCDVVFFLSRASQFMDNNDIRLLTAQLPQNGVKKLVMIGSRFDDGIADTVYDYDSLGEAIEETTADLNRHASAAIRGQKLSPDLAKVLEPCGAPIFISSMCWNMADKQPSEYDEHEALVYKNINPNKDADSAALKRIGNIDTVQGIFNDVVAEKTAILSEKSKDFVPSAQRELKTVLDDYKARAEKTLEILKTGDRNELEKQKKFMSTQITGVKGSVEEVFGETLAKLESAKMETMRLLREASRDAASISEKTAVETHVTSYRVSDSKWYKPSTWGKSHREYSTYETSYQYLDASDALENIRNFSSEACSYIEKAFYSTVDIVGTKRRLLGVVTENFDTSSELFDPGLFKLITEQTLSQVVFPVIKMDISSEQQAISSRFSGEVRNSSDRYELRRLLSSTIEKLLDTISARFTSETQSFRTEIDKLKSTFTQQLLENIETDFARLLQQLENKENEIKTYEKLLSTLKSVSSV